MPTVAQIAGGVRIAQYYGDHNPPHFHALHGSDEVLIEIALPMNVYAGRLKPGTLQDVMDWAQGRRALLALNWVDAQAQQPIKRIL